MNIVGPLPIVAVQKKFLLVATDYFNKWVEAKAYASIKYKDVSKFVWKNIVCRFEVPQATVADNRPQFDSIVFRTFCSKLNIRNPYSTPCYPQSNKKAETTNKTIVNAHKKRLEDTKGKWLDELFEVLWTYWTTSRRPTWATPFVLAYGMEVVILTEIGMPTARTTVQDQRDNDEELIRQLDWADEIREYAAIRMTSYHQMVITYYNKKARPWFFWTRTLVLRRIFENIAEVGPKKLQANWKGLYVLTKTGELGAYHLQTLDDIPMLRLWNVSYLKQYFQ